MTVLQAQNARLALGDKTILNGIDCQIESGEMVGILGPNGAGKSTLLRALSGILPCPGIRIDEREIAVIPLRERARHLAYLPQNAQAYWQISCRDIVALGRLPHRSDPTTDRAVIDEAMAEMDVTHLAGRALTTLSGGERARVLLARALAVRAPILLADEPIAHLDSNHQLRVLERLRTRADRGDAVVVVLHDLSLALRSCDRVYVINQGHVAAEGPPGDIFSDELLASVFGITVVRGEREGKLFLQPWTWITPS